MIQYISDSKNIEGSIEFVVREIDESLRNLQKAQVNDVSQIQSSHTVHASFDRITVVNSNENAVSVSLPPIGGNIGKILYVAITLCTNTVSFSPLNGKETINNTTSTTANANWSLHRFIPLSPTLWHHSS